MFGVCCLEERRGSADQVALKNSIHNIGVIECLKHGAEFTGMLSRIELCEGRVEFRVSPGFVFEQ